MSNFVFPKKKNSIPGILRAPLWNLAIQTAKLSQAFVLVGLVPETNHETENKWPQALFLFG